MTEDEMLDGVTSSVDVNLSGLQATVKDREACVLQSMGSQRVGHDSVPGQKQQYAESKKKKRCKFTEQKQIHRHRKQMYDYQRGKG